jgi:hypothetical protein
MSNYEGETSFLFASPGFIQGIASAIDIGGTLLLYNESQTTEEADMRAIANDWAMVGKDIRSAAESFAKK